MEEYQVEKVMLKAELQEVKEIIGCRKEREGGKRKILKDTPVASTEEVVKALQKAKEGTNGRKKAVKKTKQKGSKKQVESSEDEIESSTGDSSDILEPLGPHVFDCIEVA